MKCANQDKIGNILWNKGLNKYNDERLLDISKKSSEQMHREYANGTRDKNKIVEKANEARRKKGLDKFKTNPSMHVSKRGYLMIYVPGRGNVKYHHYIWEQKYGKLPKGMHLHHIDGNRLNNKIENLQLLTPSEHCKLHFKHTQQYLKKNWNRAKTAKRNSKGRFKPNNPTD